MHIAIASPLLFGTTVPVCVYFKHEVLFFYFIFFSLSLFFFCILFYFFLIFFYFLLFFFFPLGPVRTHTRTHPLTSISEG